MLPLPRERAAPSTIVVVDDDTATRTLIARWVKSASLEVVEASTGDEALRAIRVDPERVAAVILDLMLPGRNGYDVLTELRSEPATETIPVVLVSAHANDEPDVVKSIERGASDHIAKPFSGPVLLAKVKNLADQRAKFLAFDRRLRDAEAGALRDPLTGLFNRRQFDALFSTELAYAKRHATPFALALIDIDHFKGVNDSFGHQAGDTVLCHFSDTLRQNLRTEDHAFRIGGEEFALLLRATDETGAGILLKRLREVLRGAPLSVNDAAYSVRFSAGVTSADGHAAADVVIRRADEALYAAKRGGRDRTVLAGG